jgi:glycosyltransferase involved in cell wall biosynthesis
MGMDSVFFSIIIPVYKVEKYLDECIQSVLFQSFCDYECVLVDDGSPDKCPVLCDEYALKYKRIRVIHKENGGLSDARNAGILAAAGEYIVLLDSDDKFANSATLQKLHGVIQKYKTDVVLNVNWYTFTDNGEKTLFDKCDKGIVLGSPAEVEEGILKSGMYLAGCWFVVAKDYLLRNSLFFKKILHEDEHWMPRVLAATEKIALNHFPFYAYRIARDGSIMTKIAPQNLFDTLSIIDDLFEWAKDKKTYGEEGCNFMLKRVEELCRLALARCKIIKQQYKEEYRNICRELRKRIKKIPIFYFKKKFLLVEILGVDFENTRKDLSAKIRGVKRRNSKKSEFNTKAVP